MGVKGLWKLIESCGVPIPLETLDHKVLGVDVSIWLHQAVRGFRGPGGAAVANAHLLTLFHRICKLLFYRIRPVFIFDGGVPHLKKQTMAARRLKRDVATSKAKQVRDRLLSNLLKSQAVRNALGKTGKGPSHVHVLKPQKKEKDMFELPPLPQPEEGVEEMTDIKLEDPKYDHEILEDFTLTNLHNFDHESSEFKALPIETQQLILSELQVTRKENSWASINNMPQEGKNFAEFQMGRLMKRRNFQVALDSTQEEIRKKRAVEMEAEMFGDLEKHVSLTHRIISEDSAHSILVKKVKENDVKNEEKVIKKEEKGKSLMKKKTGNIDKDFLTELAKEGIVKPNQNSDSESDLDDPYCFDQDEDYEFASQKKREMEEDGLLQIVGSLMENNGLTQDEILALIKQDTDGPKSSAKQENNADKPSTSSNASGFVFNPDADSSDDDSDLVEITEANDAENFTENTTKMNANGDLESTNVGKILETKNDSLWMKIVQQKLDDMVHSTAEKDSPKKAFVDTRRTEENKTCVSNKQCEKAKGVAISLDFEVKPLKIEDDIFADIFTDINAVPVKKSVIDAQKSSNGNSLKAKDILENTKHKNSVGSSLTDVPHKNDTNIQISTEKKSNKNRAPDTVEKLCKDTRTEPAIATTENKINSDLQAKIQDLVRLEVEKLVKPLSNGNLSKENVTYSTSAEEETAVDDVEIMSSSDDSDIGDENIVEKPEKNLSLSENNAKENVNGSNSDSNDDDDFIEVSDADANETIEKIQNEGQKSLNGETESQKKVDENTNEVMDANKSSNIFQTNNTASLDLENQDSNIANHPNNQTEDESSNSDSLINEDASASRLLENEAHETSDTDEVEKPLAYSSDELKHLEEELASEQQALVAQAQKVERVASNLNDQMYGEAQELLQLFGIPYLVAPMEAEAQCAFLNAANLTAGTITDDSDIFLFGGSNVYKNFFNQTKHVELFKSDNIKANIGLDRDKMICLALLTGSDYTVGVESVGGVLAMEVLAEFPGGGMECLNNLKKWWDVAHRNVSASYQSKVKQRMSQIMIPESFPNQGVFEAYYKPEVDESLEKFSWAIPNVDALRMFTMEKFGWNTSKADEILIPVMKKLGVKTSQTRIDSYFTNIKLVKEDKFTSKRVKDAIARNKGEEPTSYSSSKERSKRKNIPSKGRAQKKRKVNEEADEPVDEDNQSEGKAQEELLPQREEPAPKKPSRTLLIDPSESNSSPAKPKRGHPKKKEEKSENQVSGPSSTSIDMRIEEVKPKRKVTKEDMYKALLKKEKIAQREADKKEMDNKKRAAAQLLKDKLKKQKR